jgi:CRISPR type III-A-associated RAMP protein Csm5
MSKIKITTLTSVHIGSGETLQFGSDFVRGKVGDDAFLSVVDPKKVLGLIGEDNVQRWVTAIEKRESTDKIVQQFAPNASLADYSRRLISEWSTVKNTDTLKEHIHDGRGLPYIPGSSIKGAIRTAVLATLARTIQDADKKIDKSFLDRNTGKKTLKADAKKIEAELFGSNPNEDVFRFLQVGDAYFGDNYEVAIRMVNINERERQSFWDESKSQLIEAIPPEDDAEFQLKLNETGYNLSLNRVQMMPDCMKSLSALFQTINNHTRNLLEGEIEYWQERQNDDDTDKVSLYIEKIQGILEQTQSCEVEKECVLRIGHGSGWRFITGAWAEKLKNFDSVVVPASRPKNFKYEQFDFPKTRRVDDECELLGFVKLSIVE